MADSLHGIDGWCTLSSYCSSNYSHIFAGLTVGVSVLDHTLCPMRYSLPLMGLRALFVRRLSDND
jgi:hypothetical protein